MQRYSFSKIQISLKLFIEIFHFV